MLTVIREVVDIVVDTIEGIEDIAVAADHHHIHHLVAVVDHHHLTHQDHNNKETHQLKTITTCNRE